MQITINSHSPIKYISKHNYKYTMEAQKVKKPVGGKLLKQFSVREGAIPMVGKKVKKKKWIN